MKKEELNMNIFNAEWKKQQAKNTRYDFKTGQINH